MQDKQCTQESCGEDKLPALVCFVCRVKMWNPLILPCLHTFCENCIIQWLEEYLEQFGDLPKKMRCPTCSQSVRIPVNGLEGLRYDAQISQVRSMMERLSMQEDSEELSQLERKLMRDIQQEDASSEKKTDVGDHTDGCADESDVTTDDKKAEERNVHAVRLGKCHLCTASFQYKQINNNADSIVDKEKDRSCEPPTEDVSQCSSGIIKKQDKGHLKSAPRRPSLGGYRIKHARMDYESDGEITNSSSATG